MGHRDSGMGLCSVPDALWCLQVDYTLQIWSVKDCKKKKKTNIDTWIWWLFKSSASSLTQGTESEDAEWHGLMKNVFAVLGLSLAMWCCCVESIPVRGDHLRFSSFFLFTVLFSIMSTATCFAMNGVISFPSPTVAGWRLDSLCPRWSWFNYPEVFCAVRLLRFTM